MDPYAELHTAPPSLLSDDFVHVPPYLGCCLEDLEDAWRFAAAEAEVAYRAWRGGAVPRHEGVAVYQAALDREQQAAAVVAEAMRRRAARGRSAGARHHAGGWARPRT